MLGLNETMVELALANSVRWYSYVLSREDGHVLRMALGFGVEVQRQRERPKITLKKHIEEESLMVDLRKEDALCRSRWSVGVNEIAAWLR